MPTDSIIDPDNYQVKVLRLFMVGGGESARSQKHRHRSVCELWNRGELRGTKLNYRTMIFEPAAVQKFIDDRATQKRRPVKKRVRPQ